MELQESIKRVVNGGLGNARYINDFKHSIYNSGANLLVCENKGKKRIKLGFFPITEDFEQLEKQVYELTRNN